MDLVEDHYACAFQRFGVGLRLWCVRWKSMALTRSGDAGTATFTHDVIGELAKEALDEVEPGKSGGSEVDVDV